MVHYITEQKVRYITVLSSPQPRPPGGNVRWQHHTPGGGGGGALTYMSSTGTCRSKEPPFYWPVPKTPLFRPVPFLFHTYFTFRINKEIIYSQCICQCCWNIGSFLEWKGSRFTRKGLFFNTNISGIGVGFSLGEHSHVLCFTREWGGRTPPPPHTHTHLPLPLIFHHMSYFADWPGMHLRKTST